MHVSRSESDRKGRLLKLSGRIFNLLQILSLAVFAKNLLCYLYIKLKATEKSVLFFLSCVCVSCLQYVWSSVLVFDSWLDSFSIESCSCVSLMQKSSLLLIPSFSSSTSDDTSEVPDSQITEIEPALWNSPLPSTVFVSTFPCQTIYQDFCVHPVLYTIHRSSATFILNVGIYIVTKSHRFIPQGNRYHVTTILMHHYIVIVLLVVYYWKM